MNQKLVVVLLLITIVLSITSMAVIFTVNPSNSSDIDLTSFGKFIESNQRASVGLVIQSPTGGTG